MELTMQNPASSNASALGAPGRPARWTGRALSTLVVLFLLFSASFKFLPVSDEIVETFDHLGLPLSLRSTIGILEVACVLLYALPRTAFLGGVLLTGYLGGAILTHLRVGDPLLSHTLFPAFLAAFAWAGLALRDRRIRTLFLGGV